MRESRGLTFYVEYVGVRSAAMLFNRCNGLANDK